MRSLPQVPSLQQAWLLELALRQMLVRVLAFQ